MAWSNLGMPSLAFTADSRQTEAGRLYNRSEEDETRIPLQKAIDDADYEHGHRVNELDFLTAFRSPVAVARKSNCAFNTVRVSSTGRPWIVDNDSRGGDDEHAQPNAELAIELTGQTRAERRTRFNLRAKTDIPLSALLCATFTTEEAAAAAEAAAAVKAAVEAGKKQRLEAATAAKLRGEPFAECSWREGGRQHEDARRARASLDAHRAAVAQMNETRQSSGSFEWRQPEKQQSRRGGSKLDCSTRAASSARRRPRPPPRPRSRRLPRLPPWWCCSHSGRGCTASSRAATPAAPSGQSRGSALRACCVKGSDELLKLNTHTIPASGFRVSDFFKARRVCGSNGGHTR